MKREEFKEKMELEGFKAGQQAKQANNRLQAEQQREGARMSADMAKSQQMAPPQPIKR
jgi:hypothetical protein